jgi:type VI secretion system protein ImpM
MASVGIIAGFYGKIPARGDFVRAGLPRDFIDPWDDWLQSVIAGSHARMGQDWLAAFLESPVWRFALAPGQCGARGVVGLMLPSVDRAGRYFPLSFAALGDIDPAAPGATAWLDQAEHAGLAALEQDAAPEQLAAMLPELDLPAPATAASGSLWWTDGAPRVPAGRIALLGMPDAATYATMLDAQRPRTDAADTWAGRVAWDQSS